MIMEHERIEGLEIMERALEHYGAHAQMLKCIEEMGELSRALSRAANPNEHTDEANIREEIADVSILLDQMYMQFGKDYIMRLKLARLRMLKARMDAESCVEDEGEEGEENKAHKLDDKIAEAVAKVIECVRELNRSWSEDDGR